MDIKLYVCPLPIKLPEPKPDPLQFSFVVDQSGDLLVLYSANVLSCLEPELTVMFVPAD